MTFSGRRVLAGAAVILAVAALAFAYQEGRGWSGPTPSAHDVPTPVDVSGEEGRWAFQYLRQSDANQLSSPWLADTCSARGQFPDEMYVLARDDRLNQARWFEAYRRGATPVMEARGYVVRMYGQRGSVTRARSNYRRKPFGVAQAALSADDVRDIRAAIRDAGFFEMPLGGVLGNCHSEITSLESCVGGRYHAAVRMCHGDGEGLLALAERIEQRLQKVDGWHPVAAAR